MRKHAAVLLALSLLAAGAVRADIYVYVDDQGVMHITNQPDGNRPWRRYMETADPEIRRPREGVVPVPARDTSPDRYSRYDAYILEASLLYQIPEAFIRAVIKVESDYDPNVVSWAGAQGLMQLMPETAARMEVTDPFDPRQNILGGTRYLRYLANLFQGDLVLTIAGYHAGEGAVLRYQGVPPYSTTHGYIRRVIEHYYRFLQASGG
ncbi:MAG: lytic transglycosylase domain-containing protein [Myxococcales bacterium]|nr:lytic transglycosylase domain-containing protein [Myxococcales bacterium]